MVLHSIIVDQRVEIQKHEGALNYETTLLISKSMISINMHDMVTEGPSLGPAQNSNSNSSYLILVPSRTLCDPRSLLFLLSGVIYTKN